MGEMCILELIKYGISQSPFKALTPSFHQGPSSWHLIPLPPPSEQLSLEQALPEGLLNQSLRFCRPEICISNQPPSEACAEVWGPYFENPCPRGSHYTQNPTRILLLGSSPAFPAAQVKACELIKLNMPQTSSIIPTSPPCPPPFHQQNYSF